MSGGDAPRLASHHGLYNQVIVDFAPGFLNKRCIRFAPLSCSGPDGLFSDALPDELDRIVHAHEYRRVILGLNEAISTARASGWITCFGLLCCPCSCGLTAMYLRNRTELALEAGQKFLQAHVNNTPLWTDVGVTWELQQVGLSLDLILSLKDPSELNTLSVQLRMTGVYPRLQSIDFMSSFEEGERESKATPKSDVVSVATPTATATAATPNSSSTSLPSGAICFYSKHQRYYEFTNFYRASIFVDGHWYATSENYFQSQKFKGSVAEKSIRAAHSAREAFSLAREPQFQQYRRADWAGVKDHVMLRGLRAKFSQHPHLRTLLLSTESKPLVEHTVNDSYWADGGDGSGANRLGQLLQTVRAELSRSRFARQPSITSESTLGSLREEIRVGPTSEPFGELSMLFAAPVLMNGYWYNSVAAYVYSKLFAGSNLEKTIRMSPDATTGPTAASQSENDGMRVPQFEQVQDAVMLTALYAKFAQHAELRELLVWTGERKIVCTLPDPHWGGATNRLGELLSHVRSKFVYRPAFASPTAAAAESTPRKSSAPSAVACSSPCRTAPLESVVEASVVEPAIVDSELEESESVGAGAGRTSSEGVARDGGDPREIASVPVVAAVAGDRSADTVVQSPPGALPSPTSAPPTGARVDEAPDDDNLVVADAPQESLPLEQLSSEAEATVSAGSAAPVVVVEASTDVVA